MSGKAVEWPVTRISTAELERVRQDIISNSPCLDRRCGFPTPLAGKTSHGDVDVIVDNTEWDKAVMPEKVKEEKRRNGFTHVAWPIPDGEDCVQVDFITVEPDEVDQAIQYYSHGTLGNHIGLLCRSIDLSYGYQGLSRILRDPDTGTKIGKINISKDPYEILDLLGLDNATSSWLVRGSFFDREESYEVLLKFPFFCAGALTLDNMTAANRTREAKRPETTNLNEWLSKNKKARFTGVYNDLLRATMDRDAYRQTWQKNLLGDVIYNRVVESSSCLISEIKAGFRKKSETQVRAQEWFRTLGEVSGLTGPMLNAFVAEAAKARGYSISKLMAVFSHKEDLAGLVGQQMVTEAAKVEGPVDAAMG